MSAAGAPAGHEVEVTDLDDDGRGVARIDGKVVFVEGVLPGERARVELKRRRRRFDAARVVEILEPSPDRVESRCAVFPRCGGCALQHYATSAQVAVKQRRLLDNLERIGGVTPDTLLAPIEADPWHYRRRARFTAKWVPGKGGALVGFRERHAPYVTDMVRCEVIDRRFADALPALRTLVSGLEARARIPQIEVAAGDDSAAIVVRHLNPLAETDRDRLIDFAREHGVALFLQSGGPHTVRAAAEVAAAPLAYRLPGFDVVIEFLPTDFVQVNAAVNAALVTRVVELLRLDGHESVLDLFCGLGNLTLPIARRSARVHGVEASEEMVARARHNALVNDIGNASFTAGDLFQDAVAAQHLVGSLDRLVLDPPRSGAEAVVRALGPAPPPLVVYVSCHPASLARDAAILVAEKGYRLAAAGVADMFPHTNHVESIAVFERAGA